MSIMSTIQGKAMQTKTIGANGTALYVPDSYEMQRPANSGRYGEIGTPGLETYSGYIHQAYDAKLFWPGCEPLYTRIWRSDPEVTIVRQLFSALSGKLQIDVTLPEQQGEAAEEPTDDDKRAQDFVYAVLDDMEGGIEEWITSANTRTPFYGWGWWEAVPALRRVKWNAPGDDPWKSKYDDGLVGFRRLAFRDYASFQSWEMDDYTGRLIGMVQNDPPNKEVTIPLDRSLHVTYGDHDNPEGLATLEALWRLERLLYGYEVVQGIGYEHTAGHLSVTVEEGEFNEAAIRNAARNLLSAQEGSYAAWPKGTRGEIIDATFSAAGDLEQTKQNIRVLKLALFGMQFVAISTMTGSGSYAALDDSSALALLIFNSITAGNMRQASDQLINQLFNNPINAGAFPNMTRRPEITVNPIGKAVNLTELSSFATAMKAVMTLGDDDIIAIRRHSEILPEQLPEDEAMEVEPVAEMEPDETEGDSATEAEPGDIAEDENPAEMAERVVAEFAQWAVVNRPEIARVLNHESDS